jgi:uncharacterized protein (DUF1697 family)
MKTYISMLRGINISGHRIIKMEALKALYVDLGYVNVQTFIQSGNVIFQHDQAFGKDLEKTITATIRQKFGFDVPVIIKDIEEMKQIIAANPFLVDPGKDSSKIYVTFLSDVPERAKFDKIGEGQNFAEDYRLNDKTIFVYCPNGYGNTKLSTNFLESKLKVAATSRNWKTTLELLRLAEESSVQ